MRFKGKEYTVGALRRKRRQEFDKHAFLTAEHQFYPSVNPTVPDYDQPYISLQEELMERKSSNHTTTPKPFTLHTELRASIKEDAAKQLLANAKTSPTPPRTMPSSASLPNNAVNKPFIPLTRSAKLKQQCVNEKLSLIAEQNEDQKVLRREQQVKKRVIQREVSSRSAGNDLTPWLEKRQWENKQLLR